MFRLLDPVPFEACFTRFMQRFAETLQGVVAIDGKTLRRSFDRAAGKSPLHMLHAWSADQRLLLGQLAVEVGLSRSSVTGEAGQGSACTARGMPAEGALAHG